MSDEEVTAVREFLAKLEAKLENIEQDVSKLKHVLIEGNGQPAMTVRVAILENELDRVKEERADRKMPRSVWIGIMVSILLALASIGASAV